MQNCPLCCGKNIRFYKNVRYNKSVFRDNLSITVEGVDISCIIYTTFPDGHQFILAEVNINGYSYVYVCVCIFTCFCRVMRSQSSTNQGFSSSGIFTFTSTRLVNISSCTHRKTHKVFAGYYDGCVLFESSNACPSSLHKDTYKCIIISTKLYTNHY